MVTVRFFAAAREATGCSSVELSAGPIGQRLGELGFGPRFDEVLAASTLLSDGQRLTIDQVVADGATVDVLPPFAGG